MIDRHSSLLALALIIFGGLAASATDELTTTTPVDRKGDWWQRRHEKINARAKQGEVDLILIGDSITQGWEGDQAQPIWEKFYGKRKAMNAGISGDRTQHVLWRLENGNIDGITPKLAIVMIGTNNAGDDSPVDIAAGITAIVHKLREKLPETKVLLLGIFPRGPDADDAKQQSNLATNQIIKSLDDGQAVYFLDISDDFLADDGTLSREIMPDLLHLNAKGYEIWAEAIEPTVAKLLAE